ncbi:hypothetical protein DDK22_36765 [Cupriavidus necator]|uniref:Uncharacterized protein n=1 Tax=Cupriavidus necator TaxID=106590 RepID=A0A367P7I3_CUPNE|nr:hypothetical protein DDK22_36765 [Cupriavidus necator]
MVADASCRAVAYRFDFVMHRCTIAEQASRVCMRRQKRGTSRPVREQIAADEQGCITFGDTIPDMELLHRII